jgi:Glycosyl transferase family 2
MKFEVRITAFNRPRMLRRSLLSLQAQTYPHWNATVYDDSSNGESQAVVDALGDKRVVYRRNSRRLGAMRNIEQCFSPAKVLEGDFGCLLEDDNFWLPDFLSSLVRQLQKKSWDIILTNQRLNDEGVGLRPPDQTTRRGWFPAGPVHPLELRATLLFMEGISNGGLVWKLGEKTDLRIGDSVSVLGLTEYCRSLVISAPFLFIEEAHGVCTIVEKSASARANDQNRAISRGAQRVRDYILNVHRDAVLPIAQKLAERHGLVDRLVQALSYDGHPVLASRVGAARERFLGRALIKGAVVRLVEKDPCAAFFRSGRIATIASVIGN